MADTDVMLTITEAAVRAGVSRITVWRWVRDGKITAYTRGGDGRQKWLRAGDVDEMMRFRPVAPSIATSDQEAGTGKAAA